MFLHGGGVNQIVVRRAGLNPRAPDNESSDDLDQ